MHLLLEAKTFSFFVCVRANTHVKFEDTPEVTEFWFKSSLKLFVKSKSTSENIIYRIVAIVLIRKYNRLYLGQSRISVGFR